MNFFGQLRSRMQSWLRAVTSRSRLEQEMDAELQFHIESYIADLVKRGVPHAEATRRAKIEFGGAAVHKEEMRASLGLRLWDDLWADLRYALRMMLKSPGFTAIAVGSLALGIGANTAIFTLAKEILLEKLSVPHPEQLRLLYWTSPQHTVVHHTWGDWDATPDKGVTSTSFPYPVYVELRKQNHVLQDLFGFKGIGRLTVTVDGEAGVVQAEMVSGNYYQALGVRPALGRAIEPSDDAAPGSGAVVVISDGFWTTHFARSPTVIGKTIRLNSTPMTIIGVNPPGFTRAKTVQVSSEVFVPFSMQPVLIPRDKGSALESQDFWWMQMMARSRDGIPDRTAQASLDVAFQAIVRASVKPRNGEAIPHLQVMDGSRGMNESARDLKQPAYLLSALAGLVLLLACTNIANLLLAKSAARQREMSVRLALGASRGRVLRQVLTESLLLSSLGGAAGFVLGYLGRNAIPHLMSTPWQGGQFPAPFDGRIFAFTAGISILTGLLFGLAPAWNATRTQVNAALKDNALTTTHRRKGFTGKAIVSFQIALSTLLVVGAVLFVRTLANLGSVNPGFKADHLLLFAILQPRSAYPPGKDIALHRELEEKLAAVPGVESVTLSSVTLIANDISDDDFFPLDRPNYKPRISPSDNMVGNTFFSTMGIPIVAGRAFNAGDTETSSKVAVVSEALVREIYPGINPIGKTFRSSFRDGTPEIVQIVGVSADTHYDSLRKAPPPVFYQPYRQLSDATYGMTYEIRTHVDPTSLAPLLRRVVQSVDKDLPLIDVRTQQEQIDSTIQQERIFASLTAGFGILGLTLACIGIYGIMAYTVSRRTNEIGIRLALGAQAKQVLLMILGETSWLAAIGVAAGLGAALVLSRFLGSMLFGLKPNDPVTLAAAAFALFAVALVAGFVPARRASRVQPMEALRHE